MFKKIIAICLLITICLTCFVACKDKTPDTPNENTSVLESDGKVYFKMLAGQWYIPYLSHTTVKSENVNSLFSFTNDHYTVLAIFDRSGKPMWDDIKNATTTFVENGTIVNCTKTFGATFVDADKPRVITDGYAYKFTGETGYSVIRQQMVVRTDSSRLVIDAYYYEVNENRNTLCLLLIPKSDIGEAALEEYRTMLENDFRVNLNMENNNTPEETTPETEPSLTGQGGTAPTEPTTTETTSTQNN